MKQMITIVGLGPGSEDEITLGALKALQMGEHVVLRTAQHGIASYLRDQDIRFTALDEYYTSEDSYDAVYTGMIRQIVSLAEEGDVVLGVPGHPLIGERLVFELMQTLEGSAFTIKVVPGISRADAVLALIQKVGMEGLHIMTASEVFGGRINSSVNSVVLDIHNRVVASELKLHLLRYYPSQAVVYYCSSNGEMSCQALPLHQLDHRNEFDHTSCLYIPAVPLADLENYDFGHLTEIMARLRAPGGCPWDREQDHKSLKQYLIEETYEVLEAIDLQDVDKLTEELGDLLLQVVFHAQMGKEYGEFDIMDVTTRICRKMIDRHTHIFGDVKVDSAEEVVSNWEAIKKQEKGLESHTQVLRDIPANLPALMRSYKVQKKAALVGFDWERVEDALLKVDEELKELRSVYPAGEADDIAGELGDLLFAVVNVARFLQVQPELALTSTIEKFIKRFAYIEKHADRPLEEMTLAEMDVLWNQAKSAFSEASNV